MNMSSKHSDLYALWKQAHTMAQAAYEKADARLKTGLGGDAQELIQQYVAAREREMTLLNELRSELAGD
jgi:hypothetical protein